MYLALLFAITLATALILHSIASLISLIIWHISRRRLDSVSSAGAATLLLSFRFFPLALTLFLLSAFVVPAFLAYEPRATVEPLSPTLLSLAGVTAIGLLASISRCVSAILQSRRVMRDWLSDARLLSRSGGGVEVYLCRTAHPVIATMGLRPTRIFVSHSVLAALSPDEFKAALAHEAVHAGNFDIAKKMLFQLAPAFLPGLDLLNPIHDHWSRMCELVADEQSVADHRQHIVHLASALVKVVRLTQGNDLPALSAALARPDESLLGCRVRRLLQFSEDPARLTPGYSLDPCKVLLAGSCLVLALVLVYPHALSVTHELLEFLVRGLHDIKR